MSLSSSTHPSAAPDHVDFSDYGGVYWISKRRLGTTDLPRRLFTACGFYFSGGDNKGFTTGRRLRLLRRIRVLNLDARRLVHLLRQSSFFLDTFIASSTSTGLQSRDRSLIGEL
ncbi:hypothetical protein M6B38_318045 [Iris pallida]|uniref:Uncharacterized protein n=1 Tax=Iris pallida TaxID=29817 RepID=A0AAX6HD09_IRIPA|nr:hypothetical protein M6B38_318045 [Iris pallida]